jgi:hypothetical protein
MQNNGRLSGYWLCFSPDTPQEKAAARFREKYGYPPREVILQRGLLWVGPVGEERPAQGPEPRPASVIRRAEAAQRPLSPARALQLALQLEVEQ